MDGENCILASDSLNNILPDETTLTSMIPDKLIYNLASFVINSLVLFTYYSGMFPRGLNWNPGDLWDLYLHHC